MKSRKIIKREDNFTLHDEVHVSTSSNKPIKGYIIVERGTMQYGDYFKEKYENEYTGWTKAMGYVDIAQRIEPSFIVCRPPKNKTPF